MARLVRWILIAALALTGASGCANRLSVDATEHRDLASYDTWAWLPHESTGAADERPGLELEAAALFAQGFSDRGYSESAVGASPDLLVTVRLSVTAKEQLRTVPHARETLDSSDGRGGTTYVLDRPSSISVVPYEAVRLTVEIRDARDQVVIWRAIKRREVRGRFQPYLQETLGEVFEHVPSHVALN